MFTLGAPDIKNIVKILEIEGLQDRKDLLSKILIYTQQANRELHRKRDPIRKITPKSKTVVSTGK